MDTLQDEMLHCILSRVPASDLLALRLVCRRWSRVILARPVWQGRHLIARNYAYQGMPPDWINTGLLCAIVRLVPALRRLSLIVQPGSLAGLPAARALARGTCQVQSLELSVQLLSKRGSSLNHGAMAALRRMLQGLCLVELKLDIYVSDEANHTYAAQRVVSKKMRQILGWVSMLPVAKLKFSFNCGRSQRSQYWNNHSHDDCVSGELTGLTALRELHIVNCFCCGAGLSSTRSLLARNTLQSLRADGDISPVLSDLPRNLRELHIPTTRDWGFLRQCENLDVLTVFARGHSDDSLDSLGRLLSLQGLPREVRVVVSGCGVAKLLVRATFLGQVRLLELEHCHYENHAHWIQLLQRLVAVTDLRLGPTFEPLLPAALFWWPEDAVPRLASLTIPCGTWRHWQHDVSHVRAVVGRLKTSRPRLVLKTYN
ncbi:uncharacterized protein LOC117642418 isoform X2 [Thrips palmi]|nr:uncharacterized protein LOC117642418 isoform X2 [Thrips palmi]XP_034236513.1 uncharacterized protein LOC117642418 isoform X2 [Thrips palmi]XP_034236514.1 uncharacterized protein LOC117642418 isoform X2 [Thrips palmi]XP_034236516.1 uncharacterized protein LOC117642418 isoform X2 [Thrips palmi]